MLKKLFKRSLAQQHNTDIEMWQGWDAWVNIDRIELTEKHLS